MLLNGHVVQNMPGWGQTYCRHADPTRRKAVPSKAVRMRNTKKAARLGDKAVPILQAVNSTDVKHVI